MKKIISLVLFLCLAFLIGTGLQGFVVGVVINKVFNFTDYNFFGWIVQVVYFVICFCIGYFKIKNNPNAVYTDIRAEGNLKL
jgi:hypothetical protein